MRIIGFSISSLVRNYYNYINVLEKFAFYSLEDVQFILTARTVLYDTRIREANEILKVGEGESKVIDLNLSLIHI